MFGVGPGALQSDARMLGLDATKQRDMMDEALGVIRRLFAGEIVTHESDWFKLVEAQLQLRPYSEIEIAVANQVSPAGARCAGKHGAGLLSIGATTFSGFDMLGMNWAAYAQKCHEAGREPNRASWRLVGPMHIAETREQARKNVLFGLGDWLHYFNEIASLPMAVAGSVEQAIDELVNQGFAVIGTPDDAVAQLERLQEQSGGFGAYLHMATNWASTEHTKRSYELFSRYVMPRFQSRNDGRKLTVELAQKNRPQLLASYGGAIQKEFEKHAAEQKPETR
jgi:limonene 1,2-monooxygenase